MEDKINKLLFDVQQLAEEDLDKVIAFVLGILKLTQSLPSRPKCPHCGASYVIKWGFKNGSQRFKCRECNRTFEYSTGTIAAYSHYSLATWSEFIHDTIKAESLDSSAEKLGFSHQTAFNMRHKVLLALQDLSESDPTILSDTVELDETFVLDCYKGAKLPESVNREPRKHGAKAVKKGISSEYVAICAGVQRDGEAMASSANRAKPSKEELASIFNGHIASNALVLTDGLRSYRILEETTNCTVVDINREGRRGLFNLNAVSSFHSYIKATYKQFRGVATKYLNRYNALFSAAFRYANDTVSSLYDSFCKTGRCSCWHGLKDVRTLNLLAI